MRTNSYRRMASAALLTLACGLSASCKKKSPGPAAERPAAPQDSIARPPAVATPSAPNGVTRADRPPAWLDHPQVTPGTTVLTALDPAKMAPTEIEFGVAPKLSKDIEYQPNIILMEQGDRAIKSAGSDGMTWKFDANAPHVSEFAVGRIVFATGRAVGRIIALKKEGETVSAILGPIQLTDVIRKGRFVMDQPLDPEKMISYVAPDYPSDTTTNPPARSSSLDGSPDDVEETVVVSRVSRGRWVPTSMSQTYGDGRRVTYRRKGRAWSDAHLSLAHYAPPAGMPVYRFDGLPILPQQLPSMPQGVPHIPNNPVTDLPPVKTTGKPPVIDISEAGGNLQSKIVGNNSFLGLQYYYNKGGVHVDASGLMNFHAPRIRCVLTFSGGGIDSAGISIDGAAGITLELAGRSPQEAFANVHVRKFVPIDVSIPLAGAFPLSLTFATLFDVNSGFSAKSSLLTARGEYTFTGGIWAGTAGGTFTVATPANIAAVTDLGKSLDGISVGINSMTMAFSLRSLVGIGAFGFNTGVFASVRFGGSLLRAPNEAFACRQATIGTFIDTGVGYQIPGWAAAAINFFLGAVAHTAIDAAGTLAPGPSTRLFHEEIQIPTGCASQHTG